MAKESNNSIIDTLEDFFKKAPAIPANGREAIVNITPILAIIFGIIGVLTALSGFGILTFLAPFAALGGAREFASYGGVQISMIFYLVASAMLLMSYPGVKARKLSGWNLLFWSEVVNIVSSVISGSILNGVIAALIGFYLLFQIKSYYK